MNQCIEKLILIKYAKGRTLKAEKCLKVFVMSIIQWVSNKQFYEVADEQIDEIFHIHKH